ncbi:RNA polymerase sigma factor [Bacillus phage Moonbeam]|uniref:RNA polymerase sigma factor n=1 Tax=Bacillus phage Moonbeam TaxID=1540091 RepID=A0A0A0RV91_9CAUD|nr:RNA polymerase sigma factor [Bacillus phage Moonbeam]AIW03563.1 RNA polymerase sigma factor [Bacillus phage Moonbeam]
MAKSKFLSKEEVRELIKKSHGGDQDARDLLVQKNVRLVWNVVQRFINRGYEPEDLFQIGAMGLLRSIDKFDFNYDVQFSTYAVPMIIGEIQRFIRDDGTVKVPRTLKELANRIARENLYKESPEIIIEKLGLESTTVGYVNSALRYLKEKGGQAISTDETVYENDGDPITVGDQMAGDVNGANWLNNIALRQAIEKLDEREQQIVQLRYFQDRTQSETADELGVSQVQISRLEKKILASMKEGFNEEEQVVVKPEPKVKKMVVAVGKVKKQKEEEMDTVGYNKNPKGNREEAIRLLESTELTYKEIATRTEVPLSTIGYLASKYRSKAVKNKNRANNAPRKGNKKPKNKETMKKKPAPTQATPVQATPPISVPVAKKVPLQPIATPTPPKDIYVLGNAELSPAMQRMEEQGKQLATHMIRVQAEGMMNYVNKMDEKNKFSKEEMAALANSLNREQWDEPELVKESKAKVEYNFNFNVSGQMVSKEEVIAKLDELKTVLSHIDIDAVNFRINVGS